MKSAFSFIFAMILVVASTVAEAQTVVTSTDSTSLNGQYQLMLRRSKTEFGYKVVNPVRLSALWKSVMDTVNGGKLKLKELQKKTDAQAKTITEQTNDLSAKEQVLSQSQTQVDNVNLVGASVTKTMYNSIMWGLVIAFALALAIVIFRSGSNRREARYRIKLFEELSAEFQAHKVKANEKEKKLARELQDERNKLDDLLRK